MLRLAIGPSSLNALGSGSTSRSWRSPALPPFGCASMRANQRPNLGEVVSSLPAEPMIATRCTPWLAAISNLKSAFADAARSAPGALVFNRPEGGTGVVVGAVSALGFQFYEDASQSAHFGHPAIEIDQFGADYLAHFHTGFSGQDA